jgi:hypothetical protein
MRSKGPEVKWSRELVMGGRLISRHGLRHQFIFYSLGVSGAGDHHMKMWTAPHIESIELAGRR